MNMKKTGSPVESRIKFDNDSLTFNNVQDVSRENVRTFKQLEVEETVDFPHIYNGITYENIYLLRSHEDPSSFFYKLEQRGNLFYPDTFTLDQLLDENVATKVDMKRDAVVTLENGEDLYSIRRNKNSYTLIFCITPNSSNKILLHFTFNKKFLESFVRRSRVWLEHHSLVVE